MDNSLLRFKSFCEEVLSICDEVGVKPIIYGSLAVRHYTGDESIPVNDMDFLVPDACLESVLTILNDREIEHSFDSEWRSLTLLKGDSKIELDSIELYHPGKHNFECFDFFGSPLNIIGLSALKAVYYEAALYDPENPSYKKKCDILRDVPEPHLGVVDGPPAGG
ncbi:hypothetical protein [Rhodococcus qingshengii]|uniref:hypothetical protein n=1 Tax=Rhodococcus qingshengii TaxID=334542 RepID=UPI00117A6331|nr:hypothetical protein [Rhodococcus qingshengii]